MRSLRWTYHTRVGDAAGSRLARTAGAHVRKFLSQRLAAVGLEPHIHIVRTSPTASLPVRAARVAEMIHATASRSGGGPLHLIGHSSGGLDVRLLTAPGVGLPTSLDVEGLASRVQTVVTVSTPHHGTPLASFFTTSRGQQLMQLLSLSTIYILSFGHLPLTALLWMGSILLRFGGLLAGNELLDELFGKLLEDFTPSRRRAVRKLLADVVHDQALMLQLAPEAMEVFNASVLQRPGLRYGAVVGQAAPPSLHATLQAGLDPGSQVTPPSTARSTGSSKWLRCASRRSSHPSRHEPCDAPTG